MDVWSSQQAGNDGGDENQEQDWEMADQGKDALIVLVDARKNMMAPPSESNDAQKSWFHACMELLVKLMKSKVIASDNSLLGIVFFGVNKRAENSTLDNVYEFQSLGYTSAQRIKDLQALIDEDSDPAAELESMDNSDKLSLSNALWHCGIAFSNANLKKKDSQRIWIFTNDDNPPLPDADERGRIQKQNHAELKRTLNLFYIIPPGKDSFDLSLLYSCAFKDFSGEEDEVDTKTDSTMQPAFPVSSLNDLMEGSLRKRFRKRRLTTFPLHITKEVSLGVELYALAVVQRKSAPVALDQKTNAPLKAETKWLCEDTGAYLTPDQIKRYIDYGGKRVYFSRDDIVQIKYYDSPGLQLICFKPLASLKPHENVRSPYFVYPCDGYIEGSSVAFMALLNSMVKKRKFALARLIARKTSEPRLVALVPQEEVNDELGQVQPTGFNVVFLPYLDDIRDISVECNQLATDKQVDAAKSLISKLKLTEVPTFENPELQKHYATIQALALGENELEFDESKDTTLPDEEGFAQEDVQNAISNFKTACGGDLADKQAPKRKEKASAPRATPKKKAATAKKKANDDDDGDEPVASDALNKTVWVELVKSNAIQKKTVAQLKEFLHAHDLPTSGRKADLIETVRDFLDG
ncbi:TPA: hypothetical protein N0F65_012256 [Lagenidium giganteum]|uniref:SAP domain-containing protein n=1 Tax=Lagenidium giganteum TaxID=4803 RepID=A0AAV2ZCC1_9STRA|nr:TPA: hypothetical protein N0F65_012256 [Lagenidium giganteum]